jgi:hypothetical protein
LLCSVFVLLAGMTFQSGILRRGMKSYWAVTALVAIAVIGSVAVFLVVLALEVYRSLQHTKKAHELAKRRATMSVGGTQLRTNSLFFARSGAVGSGRRLAG